MTYTIALPDTDQPKEYKQAKAAKEWADKTSKERGIELQVLDTDTGSVVHVSTPVEGRYFHPWERVETPAHQSPAFEGYTPAYQRKRIQATVYRGADGTWLVWDGRSSNSVIKANTKETRHMLTDMRHGLVL